MPLKKLNLAKTQELLNSIMEFELAGVVRYTHYSLMVSGPNRIPIVQFMKQQANESLLHATMSGEILTGLGGHPSLQIAPIPETHKHSVKDILEESLSQEGEALELYRQLLDTVEDRSVYLEEFARTQIAQEEVHGLEVRKMLRDVGAVVIDGRVTSAPSFGQPPATPVGADGKAAKKAGRKSGKKADKEARKAARKSKSDA